MTLTKLILAFLLALPTFVLAAAGAARAVEPPGRMSYEPRAVWVEKTGHGSYLYLIDGQPEFLIGMGYNPIYRYLSTEERAARYDADFQKMREAGINTITGWDADKGYEQDKFDWLTLDKAWEHGLGVVMPFYLPPEGDYLDPIFRAHIKESLIAKVMLYRNHPAIRMWGVGNEVFEPLIEREEDGLVEAFAELYLELADAVHAADPYHPVIYREAEDLFLPYATWYNAADGVARPWLLYGMNAYSLRLEEILSYWPALGYDMPLFISEFGPEGWNSIDRPNGFLLLWEIISARPEFVLGAAPYVWTTEGPEPVDREFGLIGADGNPVDSSFEFLAAAFRSARLEVSAARLTPSTTEMW